eukprot:CAMPEP_0203742122 /NCGR_PEP_ID=MMETSP0092-20131115/56553_1 /ASSEMBLY_ACC=CAM_ASM_001090 /TAXON_ID=426623 /ORGANISM="Chaetoceros affinis, Strain CCMP159" /LENGTH=76 /DNA_ID=CAMNT_0050629159 /DNA_START=65 /DNA_END=292 /DNA_ORIENTATION=-
MSTVNPKRKLRGIESESAQHPTRKEAGAPRRKKASAISPPNFLSLWSLSYPNSSAAADKFGARRFWSANKSIVVME